MIFTSTGQVPSDHMGGWTEHLKLHLTTQFGHLPTSEEPKTIQVFPQVSHGAQTSYYCRDHIHPPSMMLGGEVSCQFQVLVKFFTFSFPEQQLPLELSCLSICTDRSTQILPLSPSRTVTPCQPSTPHLIESGTLISSLLASTSISWYMTLLCLSL